MLNRIQKISVLFCTIVLGFSIGMARVPIELKLRRYSNQTVVSNLNVKTKPLFFQRMLDARLGSPDTLSFNVKRWQELRQSRLFSNLTAKVVQRDFQHTNKPINLLQIEGTEMPSTTLRPEVSVSMGDDDYPEVEGGIYLKDSNFRGLGETLEISVSKKSNAEDLENLIDSNSQRMSNLMNMQCIWSDNRYLNGDAAVSAYVKMNEEFPSDNVRRLLQQQRRESINIVSDYGEEDRSEGDEKVVKYSMGMHLKKFITSRLGQITLHSEPYLTTIDSVPTENSCSRGRVMLAAGNKLSAFLNTMKSKWHIWSDTGYIHTHPTTLNSRQGYGQYGVHYTSPMTPLAGKRHHSSICTSNSGDGVWNAVSRLTKQWQTYCITATSTSSSAIDTSSGREALSVKNGQYFRGGLGSRLSGGRKIQSLATSKMDVYLPSTPYGILGIFADIGLFDTTHHSSLGALARHSVRRLRHATTTSSGGVTSTSSGDGVVKAMSVGLSYRYKGIRIDAGIPLGEKKIGKPKFHFGVDMTDRTD